MNESLFTRVFSYRQRNKSSPLENFITEIFSFCLADDEKFRNDFFKLVSGVDYNNHEYNISTQEEFDGYGRPDIQFGFDKTTILFECKVEASERANQLSDYARILLEKKTHPNKHIIYLTKYFEKKELLTDKVTLHLLRWFEVFQIINERHHQVTQQFKQFLKEQNMDTVKNFNIQDMLAMKSIPATISKMDELLEQFKPEFEKMFGGYSKDSSRSSQLKNSLYINFVTLNYQRIEYWLLIGFFWNWDENVELPHVGISLEIPLKKFEGTDFIRLVNKELRSKKNWEYEEYENLIYYSALKPITDFISMEDDNIPAMKKFISEHLQTLHSIRERNPKLFKK